MITGDWQDWPWLTGEIVTAGHDLARSLRRGLSGSEPVPGLEWNTSELGVHVASMLLLYQDMLASPEPLPFPPDTTAFAAERRAAVGRTDPLELAELIEAETGNLVSALGDDPEAMTNYYVGQVSRRVVAGIAIDELLVHRRDLAGVTGEEVPIDRRQALAAWDGLLPAARFFVDQSVADRLDGTYHLSFRGGGDWTIAVHDGVTTIEPVRPERADVHCSADPVAMLLMTLGRIGQLGATLRGKVVIYGRKPWLALPFSQLFVSV